ncbi:MAG: formylglycine-generating enzyme family protein [Spirochaetes bacterium]|nr:formylglycine-generating enzyme family protein [Spirochaetota bacterium]
MKNYFYYTILLFFLFSLQAVENSLIPVKGGRFEMGDFKKKAANSRPHVVELDDFYISRYEITQAEFQNIMNYNPSYYIGPDLPVHNISWYEAIEYCIQRSIKEKLTPVYKINKSEFDKYNLSQEDKLKWIVEVNHEANGYRLPTEAEWEYAARGGRAQKENMFLYSGSDHLDEVGWFYDNSSFGPRQVGLKKPNQLDLYDMSGNLYEWCFDWYGENYYKISPLSNPQGTKLGIYRVIRGGCWLRVESACRVYFRRATHPHDKEFIIGFRIVRNK